MRLLLLAGTQEARHIALALSREDRLTLTVSLATSERRPQPYGWPVRIGGFGSEAAFRDYLDREGVQGIIDATHPFAARVSERSARVAREMGLDYVQFLRPAWVPREGDRWTFLNDEAEAKAHIPEGSTVFVAIGRRELSKLANLESCTLICRIRDQTSDPFPFPHGRYLYQRAPFTVEEEVALFRRLGIDWILERNAGGGGSLPKIDAARELGLPVAMVRRPPQPEGLKISTVAETVAWVRRRL